jgi:hypothetical protein
MANHGKTVTTGGCPKQSEAERSRAKQSEAERWRWLRSADRMKNDESIDISPDGRYLAYVVRQWRRTGGGE